MFYFVSDRLKASHSYHLHFDLNSYVTSHLVYNSKIKLNPLYPYNAIELKALFVYGSDYGRVLNIFTFPTSVKVVIAFITLSVVLAALLLRFIRYKYNLPRADFLSTLTECIIPLIGGGDLHMHHKIEKLFFGIYFVGTFFIMAIYSGDIVDTIVRLSNQKITKFSELAVIKPKYHISNKIYDQKDAIHERLM